MVKTTKAQRETLFILWKRYYGANSDSWQKGEQKTYRQLRKELEPGMGWVAITIDGLYIGIEPDGYSHT